MSDDVYLFAGKPAAYWIEMERRVKHELSFKAENLIVEIGRLRGRLSFLESRIEQINDFLKTEPTIK